MWVAALTSRCACVLITLSDIVTYLCGPVFSTPVVDGGGGGGGDDDNDGDDNDGVDDDVPAAGVDQGDAHYQYTSSPEIEATGTAHYECRNREHLKEWLQTLISQSQRAANFQVAQAHDEEHLTEIRALPCPRHHPAFTGWRCVGVSWGGLGGVWLLG